MRVYAMTGCGRGIGAAVRTGLEKQGHRVIGADLEHAEVIADLSTPQGRRAALEGIRARAPGGLDGLVPCAGLGPQAEPLTAIVSVNFYGAVALIRGLKDLLAVRNGAVVVISSTSAALPGLDPEVVQSMLDENEEETCKLILALDGHNAYAGSKLALTRWMRRQSASWAREGVRMNAVAPGATMTQMLKEGLQHPIYGDAIRNFPIPTGRFGTPEEVAAAVLFLLSPEAAFCNGAVLFVDGGSDAMLRPDSF